MPRLSGEKCVHNASRCIDQAKSLHENTSNLQIESCIHTYEDNAQKVDALPRSATVLSANVISHVLPIN